MAVTVTFLIIFQIVMLVFAYFFIKDRIEKKLINKEIIDKIKREINGLIVQLNETTLNNINLIEDKLKEVDKKMVLADKKKSGLKITSSPVIEEFHEENDTTLFDNRKHVKKNEDFTYKPQKIVNQTKKVTEIIKNSPEELEKSTLDEVLKKLPVNQKLKYLLELGWDLKAVQKKLNISSGELELLLNIENINS